MSNVYIKTVEGGEKTTALAGTEGIEIDDGTTSYWAQIANLFVNFFNAATYTLTNKRITKRSDTLEASSATPTFNTDSYDIKILSALAAAITNMSTNLSGTPVEGDMKEWQITDNGTARAITWGTSFANTTIAWPTTTVISTRLRVFGQWNAVTGKWDCVGII